MSDEAAGGGVVFGAAGALAATLRLPDDDLPPGSTRRWPAKSLLGSLMPFSAARLAVVVPCLMAMALRLSPGFTT